MPPRRSNGAPKSADYRHDETRLNNPPAGLADMNPLPPARKRYEYDPRLDPQLQWAGKAEHLTFEVETVPLHIHERVAPAAIVDSLRTGPVQASMFADPEFDLNQAVEFYQHPQPWANRMVLGDSLLVMNSLLERELMAGKVQCIYFDPPYGINYRSNFQPFTNKRDVKDGDDGSLTREPEQIRAFRDTWELGIHSYLTYIRDRLLLMRELLTESGSIFVQISDENVHRVRAVMDEVFGSQGFVSLITVQKTSAQDEELINSTADYILWYGKNKETIKYRRLYARKIAEESSVYQRLELADGSRRVMTREERDAQASLPLGARQFRLSDTSSSGHGGNKPFPFQFQERTYYPSTGRHWSTNEVGMSRLAAANRLIASANTLHYVRYFEDFPFARVANIWVDTGVGGFTDPKIYVVQTVSKIIQRCILMTTDPGDLVFDPTCGSGTSAYVAEQWGRRWITCDTSRVALALARQRLMTATFPMYKLAHPDQGVKGAFIYKTVPHITLKSIAQNEPPETETLYDQPEIDRSTVRVAGPFTVEAVQPPVLDPDAVNVAAPSEADDAGSYLSRMIEQLRRSGLTVRGQHMSIKRIASLVGGVLHAECDYDQGGKTVTAAVIFGPQYGPLTSSQLQEALGEARGTYDALIAAAFTFDDQAHALLQKANLRPPVLGVAINADLLMGNLLKTSKASQVFSVFGKPDVTLSPPSAEGYTVTVKGVDIYDPNTGDFDASSADQIAAWFLDTDYDGATFLVRQAYFPTQTPNPWEKITKALKGSIDPEQFAALQRTTSLPFKAGKHKQCAVKVIDHRGNEVMTVLRLS
ncbi:MAG: site-specific DNA-methyltransferase [Kouleothrix sp.]|jgi:adenine-specific DNA-methyltransferase|nr:site-specific DNA-methyltransferase [Kouleothrix sp.]